MGWISWLCPGIQLKRWLLLFTAGVIVCAFSLALLFNNQVMGMAEELLFRLSYLATGEYGNTVPLVLGIVGMLLGIGIMVYAVRRIVRSIPAITVVGGGTGLSTLLRGMKYITGNCTAVVSVGDDGGSSGRLRNELGIIPPGDLRKCVVAMADSEPLMERVMQYRFEGDSYLSGHSLGNLFLAAIAETEGGMVEGLNAASQILKVRGHVIPTTLHNIQLAADMTDGSYVLGQAEIAQAHKTVQRLHMVPENVPATQSAVEAIRQADILVLGPGSLYTSVICNLLVPEIREAVLQCKATKIYVCNVMTQPGETDGFGAYEHVKTLTEYAGKPFLDYVIVNSEEISDEQKAIEKIEQMGIHVIPARLISKSDMVRHDPQKLAQAIMSLAYRLRLFGRGFIFFDYLFMRHNMRKIGKMLGKK